MRWEDLDQGLQVSQLSKLAGRGSSSDPSSHIEVFLFIME